MELQTLYKASSLFIKSLLLPHQTSKKEPPQNVENTQQTSPFTQKAFKALEYGHGYLDGLNPLAPTLEGIQKSLNIEPYSNSSSEYQTGKMHGALTGLTLDAALTIGGGSMMGGAGACEVSTLGVCTPVAAPAAAVGVVAASSGMLMSVGHGKNLIESQNEIHTQSVSKSESPKITQADIKDKTRTEIRELAKEKGLKEFGNPDSKDGLPKKWKDPVTNKPRLRLDRGHIDKETGKPYDIENAAVDHVHALESDGSTYIIDTTTTDYHFPTKGE